LPNKTIIAWASYTVNPSHGCSKPAAAPLEAILDLNAFDTTLKDRLYPHGIPLKWGKPDTSLECSRCYAELLSNRRGWTPKPWLEANAEENLTLRPERFREFTKVKVKDVTLPPSQRERFFVCSMSDVFHKLIPDEHIHRMLDAMAATPHIYQVLTKRPERAYNFPHSWPANIWLGTTCGHPITKWRLEYLRRSLAKTRFVSMEPLLDSMLPLDLTGIDQLIIGGESGAGYRKMEMSWAREMRDLCAETKTAYFYKQDAAFVTERRCYLMETDGRCLQYRQFPGELTAPVEVQPDNAAYHRTLFPNWRPGAAPAAQPADLFPVLP
jgi:protein gp37